MNIIKSQGETLNHPQIRYVWIGKNGSKKHWTLKLSSLPSSKSNTLKYRKKQNYVAMIYKS